MRRSIQRGSPLGSLIPAGVELNSYNAAYGPALGMPHAPQVPGHGCIQLLHLLLKRYHHLLLPKSVLHHPHWHRGPKPNQRQQCRGSRAAPSVQFHPCFAESSFLPRAHSRRHQEERNPHPPPLVLQRAGASPRGDTSHSARSAPAGSWAQELALSG